MKKNRVVFLLFAILLVSGALLAACAASVPVPVTPSKTTPAPAATATPTLAEDTPRLRIKNLGGQDIKNLTVMFPESRITFGDVPAGTTTGYLPAPNGVYNYAAYEFELDGEIQTQYVIDWMGESPRPGSSYTYELIFDPKAEGNKIDLKLVTTP